MTRRRLPPLTAEQQAFALQNTGLVFVVLQKYYPLWRHKLDEDEARSVLWETLCKAAAGYDATRGWKFSAYFSRAAWNALSNALDGLRPCLSLDYEPKGFTGCACESWLATEPDYPDLDTQEEIAELRRQISLLPGNQSLAVQRRHIDGWTLLEIGQELGVSKERARQIVAVGLNKLKERMGAASE